MSGNHLKCVRYETTLHANRLLVCMTIVAVPFDKRKSQNMYISLNSFCAYAYMVLFACVVWGPNLAHHIVVTSVCGGGAVVLSEVPYCGHMPAVSLSSLIPYCPTTPAQIVLSWLLAVYCTDMSHPILRVVIPH